MIRCSLISFSILLTVSAAFGETPTTAPTIPPLSGKLGTPVDIFNGKDLTDWAWVQLPSKKNPKQVKLEDVWSVKDGILHSLGKPTGYLVFDQDFTNYIVVAEERQLAKGNGGLLIGIQKQVKGWPGVEIQTQTGDAGDLWNHNLLKMTTDPARTQNGGKRIVKMGPDSQNPVGQWDIMKVTVDNGNLVFQVNGQLQNIATNTESLAGKIGLQSEGVPMEFRKIDVTPIEPADATNP